MSKQDEAKKRARMLLIIYMSKQKRRFRPLMKL